MYVGNELIGVINANVEKNKAEQMMVLHRRYAIDNEYRLEAKRESDFGFLYSSLSSTWWTAATADYSKLLW